MEKRSLRSRRCSSAKAPSSASTARSSASFRRKHLLERAHRHAFINAAAVERVGGDQRLGFLARRAVDDDQRAGAGAFSMVLERATEHDFFGALFQKFLVSGAVRITQGGGARAVETNERVHGMVASYGGQRRYQRRQGLRSRHPAAEPRVPRQGR